VPEAHVNLIKKFKFSDLQAAAILEMRLSRLANLERKKIEDELEEIQKSYRRALGALLRATKKCSASLKARSRGIAKKFGDDRETKIMKGAAGIINVEDLVPDEEQVLVLTARRLCKAHQPRRVSQAKARRRRRD
jgi:DNA gyrase subunit A